MKYIPFFLSLLLVLIGILVSASSTASAWALIVFGAAMGLYAFVAGISEQHRENLAARYRTSDVRFLEEIKGADREIMNLVNLHLNAALHVYPWASGWVTIIGYSGCPRGFAAEFLSRSDNTNLAAINTWSDKSLWVEPGFAHDFGETRVLAHKLTEYLLDIGAAKKSFGNNPPRWVSGVTPSLLRAAWGIGITLRNENASPVEFVMEEVNA